MNDTKSEADDDKLQLNLSGKQMGLLFGAGIFISLSAMLLQHVLVPAECRVSGGLVLLYVWMPTFHGGIFLLSAWSGGGDRRLLLRESGLFLAVVFANLFVLNLVECYFEGAWYGFIVHLPVLIGAFYFLTSRLMRIAANGPPEKESTEEGGEA